MDSGCRLEINFHFCVGSGRVWGASGAGSAELGRSVLGFITHTSDK